MKLYLILLLLCCSVLVAAQPLEVPEVTYSSAADYMRQNDKVVEVVNHLQNFPADVYTARRKEAAAYLLKWLAGTPDVTVTLESYAVPYLKYGESMIIFMGEYAKQLLREPGDDRLACNLAAMESVLNYYRDNLDVFGRDTEYEKLAKLQEKGKLARFIEKQLN